MSFRPTPAVVSKEAATRLPRLILWLGCLAYLIPGFIGRNAWRGADMIGLATMNAIAQGKSSWLSPSLLATHVPDNSLLPYWLGAFAIKILPFCPAEFASRIPFIGLLLLTMAAVWYACYYLALNPKAHPLIFAFGGEASPKAYARVMADSALLAFLATMGLAQLSHEISPAMTQLMMGAILLLAGALLSTHILLGLLTFVIGLFGLSLAGAPNMAWLLSLGIIVIHLADHENIGASYPTWSKNQLRFITATLLITVVLAMILSYALHLDNPEVAWPRLSWHTWNGFGQLFLWFLWPAWPLLLLTLWRWRKQLFTFYPSRHIALPFWFAVVAIAATFISRPSDRALLIALPSVACLAAFALPTMKKTLAACIEWFTLFFFSACAIAIWVIWLSLQTGFPSQPALNVQKLAPGFIPTLSWGAFIIAMIVTGTWLLLVYWRIKRRPKAMWSSLALPASGMTLCWVLFMTLWLPLLNYTQSYDDLLSQVKRFTTPKECIETMGIDMGKIAALDFYLPQKIKIAGLAPSCPWLITTPLDVNGSMQPPLQINRQQWRIAKLLVNPMMSSDSVLLMARK